MHLYKCTPVHRICICTFPRNFYLFQECKFSVGVYSLQSERNKMLAQMLPAVILFLCSEAAFLKILETWNRFHGVDSNCGIKSKLASIPKVGAGLDNGIPCSTLALGWTWFRRLLDEKPMPRLKINILWSTWADPIPTLFPGVDSTLQFSLKIWTQAMHLHVSEDVPPSCLHAWVVLQNGLYLYKKRSLIYEFPKEHFIGTVWAVFISVF